MYIQPRPRPGDELPKRRRLSRHFRSNLTPRLQRLVTAAFALRGDRAALLEWLGIARQTFDQRISMLRGLGVARTVILYDPRRMGRSLEMRTLVDLRVTTGEAIADFEAWCRQDGNVTSAARICGRFDYQMTSFHPDLRDADGWRRLLEARPEVGRVEQRRIETLKGHELAGLPLFGGEARD